MLKLTRLNNHVVAINPDHIVWADTTPDTTLFLIGGEKIIVREGLDELIARVIDFRRMIRMGGDTPEPFNAPTGRENDDLWGGSFGAGAVFQAIPSVLDLQVSALTGKGVGRYSASQLSDATFRYDGKLEPIPETVWLAGGTFHATPMLDIYAFAGREQQDRTANVSVGGTNYGLGNYLLDARACAYEVGAPAGTACNVQTRAIQQETAGFWHKLYVGSFGRVQWGMQYSYTERDSFSGIGGVAAKGDENIVMTSFRYYPF